MRTLGHMNWNRLEKNDMSQIIGHMGTHELKNDLKKIGGSQIIGHMWTHGHMNWNTGGPCNLWFLFGKGKPVNYEVCLIWKPLKRGKKVFKVPLFDYPSQGKAF